MSELAFTHANQEDIPEIAQILTDATQHKLAHGDSIWGEEGWSDEEVYDAMQESSMYLIKKGGETIGTVSLQWNDVRIWGEQPPIAGYLHRLAIKDGYHGQGLGEQAVQWASLKVATEGRALLRLDCEAKNTQLCEYYKNLGFVKVGERHIPEYGDYVPALFEKHIF